MHPVQAAQSRREAASVDAAAVSITVTRFCRMEIEFFYFSSGEAPLYRIPKSTRCPQSGQDGCITRPSRGWSCDSSAARLRPAGGEQLITRAAVRGLPPAGRRRLVRGQQGASRSFACYQGTVSHRVWLDPETPR